MSFGKVSIVIYHVLKLAGIGTIAVFAVLIYQRMPLTYGEYSKIKTDHSRFNDVAGSRLPVIFIPGTVKVDVTNDPLSVEVQNSSLSVELDGQPIDVHVDSDPLPVTIER